MIDQRYNPDMRRYEERRAEERRPERGMNDRQGKEGGGWGWLATLLAVILIAVVLWATGILDIDLSGRRSDEGIRGGGTIELTPPDGGVEEQPEPPSQQIPPDRRTPDQSQPTVPPNTLNIQ